MKRALILINPYLSTESEFYQPRRIAEALLRHGVRAEIEQNIGRAVIGRHGIEESISNQYDFCVYLDKDKYLPRILEKRGMRLFNRAEAVELCDDKMLTHIALSGIVPMPATAPAPLCYKADAKLDEEKVPSLPAVVKECFGSFGMQVHLAKDEAEYRALREQLKLRPHLLQEFIGESAGRDVRAVCVGGRVVACMLRVSDRDFRSNAALGGKGTPYPVTNEIETLCKTVSNILDLDYCGIDLLLSNEGLLVCEVNSNAFFGTIEQVTGVDVAGEYAAHICREIYKI